jgi:HSP20 family molecular chaperone IbpA
LTIAGSKSEAAGSTPGPDILYRGISARSFERNFNHDQVELQGASIENGLHT